MTVAGAAEALPRCAWCGADPLYVAYHDAEWGVPVADDDRLFEKLSLEGFQAGLAWITILRKRARFREVFDGFAIDRVAGFAAADVERLLCDPGIVRHRGKIEAVIHNARLARRLQDESGSLARFVWAFEPDPATRPRVLDDAAVEALTCTPESTALSDALRRRGWRFVGPTTVYAFMQAMGLVNDHHAGCHRRAAVEALRRDLVRPGRW